MSHDSLLFSDKLISIFRKMRSDNKSSVGEIFCSQEAVRRLLTQLMLLINDNYFRLCIYTKQDNHFGLYIYPVQGVYLCLYIEILNILDRRLFSFRERNGRIISYDWWRWPLQLCQEFQQTGVILDYMYGYFFMFFYKRHDGIITRNGIMI